MSNSQAQETFMDNFSPIHLMNTIPIYFKLYEFGQLRDERSSSYLKEEALASPMDPTSSRWINLVKDGIFGEG
ncbi:hypothetical protein A2U01_0052895 [Trifolium medium]|uniref:Uncharacterized protein n=1 Tax=Trifolium medium TaxID=97028 RepID=A0A392R530_9FABA|nr:hypothetical protein [Trifolium medium]